MTPQKIVLKGKNDNYGGQKITLKTGKKNAIPFYPEVGV